MKAEIRRRSPVVKDFMTRKVVYISPDTTVAHTADLMRVKV